MRSLVEKVVKVYGFENLEDYDTKISCRHLKKDSDFITNINNLIPEILKNYDKRAIGLNSNNILSEKVGMNFLRKFLSYNQIPWNFTRDSQNTYVQLIKDMSVNSDQNETLHCTFDYLIKNKEHSVQNHRIKLSSDGDYSGEDPYSDIVYFLKKMDLPEIHQNSLIIFDRLLNMDETDVGADNWSIRSGCLCLTKTLDDKRITSSILKAIKIIEEYAPHDADHTKWLEFRSIYFPTTDLYHLWIESDNAIFHGDKYYYNNDQIIHEFETTPHNQMVDLNDKSETININDIIKIGKFLKELNIYQHSGRPEYYNNFLNKFDNALISMVMFNTDGTCDRIEHEWTANTYQIEEGVDSRIYWIKINRVADVARHIIVLLPFSVKSVKVVSASGFELNLKYAPQEKHYYILDCSIPLIMYNLDWRIKIETDCDVEISSIQASIEYIYLNTYPRSKLAKGILTHIE